jgi:signal transduction histidine kinase
MTDKLWWSTLRQALMALVIILVADWITDILYHRLLIEHEQRYIQLAYQGPLKLVEQQLLQPPLSDNALHLRLNNVQQTLGAVKIELLPMSKFAPSEKEKMQRGEIIFTNTGYAEADHVYRQLGKTEWVLSLQMPEMPPLFNLIAFSVLIFAILSCGGIYYVLIRPYWRDVRILQQAVEALGEGQLSTRIDALSTKSTLYPLAARMNLLATRVAELLEAQRDLLNAVAHELRTPLARMYFQLERLSDCAPAESISAIEANVKQMQLLIEQVLHYASLEVYELRQDCRNIAVDEIRSWLVDFPEVHVELPADLTVWADPTLLPYALRNLVSNAIRHGKHRTWLSVDVRENNVVLHVEDDGAGIPENERERIFSPLVHLSHGAAIGGGAGMGLAITRRIAQLHGGQVSVSRGIRAGGACFSFTLPVKAFSEARGFVA